MIYSEPVRPATRRIRRGRIRLAGLLVVIAVVAAALGGQLMASSSSTAAESTSATGTPATETHAPAPGRPALHHQQRDALGVADGAVPAGTTVFDDGIPGVAKLDPALLDALRRAATAAAGNGVSLYVDSGWRSARYQEHLRDEAVAKYGSEQAAARWVDTPTTSAHVSGHAVDIGPPAATAWLSEHGAAYGLCQIYGNEPWHYELRPATIDHGCPPMYADPTHNPGTER